MSKVYFISDLHIGHPSIAEFSGKYRGGVKTLEDHDMWIIDQWNSVVNKNDMVYVLGDVCFDKHKMPLLKKLRGNKHLILGNHDKFSLQLYSQYFNKVHGFEKYKGKVWLSHAPIHHGSLRGKFNIHGHVHHMTVDDLRYISVCVESVSGKPISWENLELMMEERKCLMKMSNRENPKEFSITGALTADTMAITDGSD